MGRMKIRKSGPYLWLNSQTGYYCAVYVDADGKSKRQSLKTKDHKEATRRFNAWQRDYLVTFGIIEKPESAPSITISDFSEEWGDHIESRHPKSTSTQYKSTANRLSALFGQLPIKDFNIRLIERFISSLISDGLVPATVNKHRRHLRIMLNDAEEWGYIQKRPSLPRPLHEKEKLKYFSEEQLNALFSAIVDEQFYDFCMLALLSALRSGELIRLTVEDIDNPKGFIRISEGQKNRTESRIPITSSIAPIVEKYSTIRKKGRIFTYSSPSFISRLFKKFSDKAGLPDKSTFHGLRHSYGASMIAKGAEIVAVKELMRHKSIASTMVYAKVSPSHLSATGELMTFTPEAVENRREIVEENTVESGKMRHKAKPAGSDKKKKVNKKTNS